MLSNTKKKMDNLKTRNRNLTADFLKAVMIFCVLYGHSVSMINGLRDVTWQDSVVNVFVTTFEMPLFILISGYYLFFSLKKKPHFKVLCQRIVSIAIPLIIWEGIPAVYKFIIKPMGDGFSFINIKQYGKKAEVIEYESPSKLIEEYFTTRDTAERIRSRAQDIFRTMTNAEHRLKKKIEIQKKELADCKEKEKYDYGKNSTG